MPTFLKLYHLLTVYKILRPPKKGNCRSNDEDDNANWKDISFEDFMTVYNKNYVPSYRKEHIAKIKEEIEELVDTDAWNNEAVMYLADEMSDDIMDHLLHSNTGYICKKMLEKVFIKNCEACCKAFSSCPENSIFPLSNLIEIKTQGKLIYPNLKLFQIIKKLDKIFNENVKKNNGVYGKIRDEIKNKTVTLSFPCHEHKVNFMSEIIYFYTFVCMHFFLKNEQRKQKSESNK